MAVDPVYEGSRKRRRKKSARKLLTGEHVEVLYSDEGLKGSWHRGIVVDCGECTRLVEYTNLLSEDNCSKLKELIPVSAAIDGLSGKPLKYNRGHIRPLPPHYEIQESDIEYGLCVDAFVEDAWWEGVVFDRADGLKERLIFFPDQGDQQMVAVDMLRLTQEWEEISGCWKPRGKWLLLEVLQTFEQEEELPVSVREIWFDLRTMAAFSDEIGVWTFGSHSTWNNLVSELIHELRSVVLGLFPSTQLIDFPTCSDTVKILMEEVPSLGDLEVQKDDGVRNTNLAVALNNSFSPRSCTLDNRPVSDSSSYERLAFNTLSYLGTKNMNPEGSVGENSDRFPIQESKNDYCGLENSIQPLTVNCCPIIKASKTCNETKHQEDTKCGSPDNHLTRKDHSAEVTVEGRKNRWKPLYVEGAYYPEAVKTYGDQQLRQFMVEEKLCIVRHKVMQHLSALGWKIETTSDKWSSSRIRYWTPNGKSHYSLRTACYELLQGHPKKKKKYGNDKHTDADGLTTDYARFHSAHLQQECILQRSKIQSKDSGLHAGICRSIDTNSNNIHSEKSPSLSKMIDSGIIEEVTSSVFQEHWHSTNHAMCSKEILLSNGSEMVSPVYDDLEPGSFPEAVIEYKMLLDLLRSKKRQVLLSNYSLTRLNARKHLKFMGWKFWIKGQHRKELFITSPTGKPFRSMYAACAQYLNDEGLKNCSAGASLKRLRSISATSSKFSESKDFGVDTLVMERNKKSKREVLHHFTSSAIAALSDRRPKHPSGHSSVPKKSIRKKCQPLLSQGHEIVSSLSSHAAKPRKRPHLDMLQTPSQRVPRTVLSLLIDNDMVLPRQKVRYIRKRDGKVLMEGSVTRDGIKCKCCKTVHTLSNFEAHAGSTYRRPAASIFLSDGRSLLECQMQMIHRKKPEDFRRLRLKGDCSQYQSDSVCSVCHDGGSLVLCDHCPSSFHLSCLGLENVPEGKWFCPSCRCGICGRSEFNSDTEMFTEKSILYCDQCEREYHVGCMRRRENRGLSGCPVGNWFCSQKCSKIFHHLRQLVGVSRPTSVDGLSWTILRSSRENGVDSLQFDAETMTEHDSKLCVALDVLHECFVSIIEPRTQSDFVADLLFNKESELRRLNFYGFYTMLLEKGDELVSVATFRVYGDKVAEMPLVGTRVKYRRQGMCRLLINELEKVLSDLGVERLLLPAVPQLLQTWTTSFGFSMMTSPDRLNLLEHTVLYFQETTLCQKSLGRVSTIPGKPKGGCEELMDIPASPAGKTDPKLHSNNSEAVGMAEPTHALPLVDADHADRTQIEAEYSPVSTCINPTEQPEPESGVNGGVNVAPHKRTRNNVTKDTSPVLAVRSLNWSLRSIPTPGS